MRLRSMLSGLAALAMAGALALAPAGASVAQPGNSGTCTADYTLGTVWAFNSHRGFLADVTVTAGAEPISGWHVTWTYTHGEAITQFWNAEITSRGPNISAVNLSWNANLAPGESTTFGVNGTWDTITGTYELTCSPRG